MWLSDWARIAFYLNGVLDEGKNELTFEEVYEGIEKRNLLEKLEKKYTLSFSLYNKLDKAYLALEEIAGGLEGRERRKVGVENSGMNLLMAFVIEAIQQHYWEKN